MANDPITLNYAKPRPRWRKWAGHGMLAALLLVLLLATWWAISLSQSQISFLSHQRQCLTYTAPPTDVVYEIDDAAARALHVAPPTGNSLVTFPAYFGTPQCWDAHASDLNLVTALGGIVFLHERTGRGHGGGQRRLVTVTFFDVNLFGFDAISIPPHFTCAAWSPVPFYSSPRTVTSHRNDASWPNIGLLTRIYTGQPDPADPSHFTFDYEAYGTRDTVDGWLEADDSITLFPRSPPTPPPTAPSATGGLPRQ